MIRERCTVARGPEVDRGSYHRPFGGRRRLHPALGVLALALPVLLASCTDANLSFTITQMRVAEGTAGQCVLPTGTSTKFLAEGVLDVDLDRPYPYLLYPTIENRLPMGMPMMVETSLITLQGLDLKIIPPAGVTLPTSTGCPAEFFHATPVLIGPMDTAVVPVEGVRACHAAAIAQLFRQGRLPVGGRVIFTVALRGRGRHGGTDILTEEVRFPIRVCMGCLQTGFGEAPWSDFSYPNVPRCDLLTANPYRGNPCNPAQDGPPVLCCSNGSAIECPGVPRAVVPSQ